MFLIDAVLRYSTLSLAAILIILLVRDGREHQPIRICIYILIAVIGYTFYSAPPELMLSYPLHVLAYCITVPNTGLVWWVSMALLKDHFRLGAREWVVMGVCCLVKVTWVLNNMGIDVPAHDYSWWAKYVVSISLSSHIIWIALVGLKHDLIDSRRSARLWLVLVIGVTGVVTSIHSMIEISNAIVSMVELLTILPVLVWTVLWLTHSSPEKLLFKTTSIDEHSIGKVSGKDVAAYRRLKHIMETEKAYTDHGLSISSLAKRVAVPEHQLRALINQTMGYRNFSDYLNHYRIGYAKSVLADPEQARLPIITISMDSGFQTLSTFNRAFKSMEGKTPSTFRKNKLAQVD